MQIFLYIFIEFLHFPKINPDYEQNIVSYAKRIGSFVVFLGRKQKNIEKNGNLR